MLRFHLSPDFFERPVFCDVEFLDFLVVLLPALTHFGGSISGIRNVEVEEEEGIQGLSIPIR